MGWKEVYVVAVSLATVALWCANSALTPYLGQMGIVAILPMVAFFGFGILSKVCCAPTMASCFVQCGALQSGARVLQRTLQVPIGQR